MIDTFDTRDTVIAISTRKYSMSNLNLTRNATHAPRQFLRCPVTGVNFFNLRLTPL